MTHAAGSGSIVQHSAFLGCDVFLCSCHLFVVERYFRLLSCYFRSRHPQRILCKHRFVQFCVDINLLDVCACEAPAVCHIHFLGLTSDPFVRVVAFVLCVCGLLWAHRFY